MKNDFIELIDDHGIPNLFSLNFISRAYEGSINGQLIIQFTKESNMNTFITTKETLDSFKNKINFSL